MAKRKLSRQQAWRIKKIQDERAKRARRRSDDTQQMLTSGTLGPEREGLVIAHYGTQVEVESEPGVSQRCHLRANLEGMVTGDRVIWRAGEPTGIVVARDERQSELLRPDPYGSMKAVAANIDRICVVFAALPEPHANLLDRYLVAAEVSGITPVLVLNKRDLLAASPARQAALEPLLNLYSDLGYKLLQTSCREGGMDELTTALGGRTSVFVGQSGVGKSSLVNALLPEADLKTGPLSELTNKGTHTTTTAQLFHLPGGGSLIDSPGIREFGLWHMRREQVAAGFREFQPLLGHCRFRDCQHEAEPGCAVLAAVDEGAISSGRLDSYRRIIDSLQAPR
ncbi:MAG: small ribosomal subunit biogenesis GTPase RsgA [Parahaliea sp.]